MYTGIKTNEGTKIVSVEDKAKLYKYFDMVRKHTLTKVEATYLEPGQLNSKFYGLYLFDENDNQFDKISDLESANIILEKIGESMFTRFGFILLYVLFYLEFATAPWQYALLPFHVFMGSMHGFIVNWFGHKRGYRNFDDIKDNSKNTLPIDFLMMGELYQNNHHRRPNNMNFAVRWFEIDLGYLATSFLKKLKVIY